MTITKYHGSDNIFSKFDYKTIGNKNGTGTGFGFYFADKDVAESYGKYIYTVNLNLNKKISDSKITLKFPILIRILNEFEKRAENSYAENFASLREAALNLLEYSPSDTAIIGDIINATSEMKVIFEVLNNFGYTHTINEEHNFVVVFDERNIKIIDISNN